MFYFKCIFIWQVAMYKGGPKKTEFIYKKYAFVLTCLNFCHLHRLSFWCNTPIETFFHFSKQFLNSSILMPSTLLPFLVSPLPYQQNVALWGPPFFLLGKQKNHSGWDQVNREVGAWGSWYFWLKTAEHSVRSGQVRSKSPIMKWANALSLQKKFTEAEHNLSQQCPLVHWYRWIPRTLSLVGEACTLPPERKKDM